MTESSQELSGARKLLAQIVRKIASQLLLFSIAIAVLIIAAVSLAGSDQVMLGALLFVFSVGVLGYLFVEPRSAAATTEAGKRVATPPIAGTLSAIDNHAAPFTVRLWTEPVSAGHQVASRDISTVPTDGVRYRIGDRISISLSASRDCYLTVLNIGTSGKLTVLFPNGIHADNFLPANRVHVIPEDGYGFEYRLQGPAGTERLKAIATATPVQLLAEDFDASGDLFRTASGSVAARDIEMIRKHTRDLDERQWATADWTFEVE